MGTMMISLPVLPALDAIFSRPGSTILILALFTLIPFAVLMLSSFVKIVVVLSFLRSAVGTPQIPPGIVVNGLALILTAFVMAPTAMRSIEAAKRVKGMERGVAAVSFSTLLEAGNKAKEPVRDFLKKHTTAKDKALFVKMAKRGQKDLKVDQNDWIALIPAFVIRQLALAFQIGFLLFVPFVVIDLLVANVLLSLGMHMVAPATLSLPFKILLFVLVDGWTLLTQGLIMSYH